LDTAICIHSIVRKDVVGGVSIESRGAQKKDTRGQKTLGDTVPIAFFHSVCAIGHGDLHSFDRAHDVVGGVSIESRGAQKMVDEVDYPCCNHFSSVGP
jgi:hypothetical protein